MSRPWVLVCLLLLIVFSSQLEWRQQYENELEAGPNASQSEPHVSDREEAVKEKVKFQLSISFFPISLVDF